MKRRIFSGTVRFTYQSDVRVLHGRLKTKQVLHFFESFWARQWIKNYLFSHLLLKSFVPLLTIINGVKKGKKLWIHIGRNNICRKDSRVAHNSAENTGQWSQSLAEGSLNFSLDAVLLRTLIVMRSRGPVIYWSMVTTCPPDEISGLRTTIPWEDVKVKEP